VRVSLTAQRLTQLSGVSAQPNAQKRFEYLEPHQVPYQVDIISFVRHGAVILLDTREVRRILLTFPRHVLLYLVA
jgi:hypothetical protein